MAIHAVCGCGLGADDRVHFFPALREEFGLKLETQNAPIEVLIIDRIERPTPD